MLSYAQVAAEAGSPRGSRAAGNALGSNPIPIVVPCHRVLRSGGALGGYAGGLERKRWLLELEGAIGVIVVSSPVSAAVPTAGTPKVLTREYFDPRFRATLGSLPRELAITLLVTVIVTVAASPLVALLTEDRLYAWIAALIASATFLGGLLLGAAVGAADDGENLDSKIRELESRTGELGAHETYAEHLRDALRDLAPSSGT